METRNVVLVTGAAGNLGRAAVEQLAAQKGMRLVLMDRSAEKLNSLIAGLGPDAQTLAVAGVDLTDFDACSSAIKRAVEKFGGIGALVNTVGGFQMGKIAEAVGQWDAMMAINARTALTISAAVLPIMQAANYGRIVHIAAATGLKAPAGMAAYASSKAAVLRLTESLAEENRKHRITANCIMPTTIDTPQNRAAMPDAKTDSWVSPQSIARLISFLVSPASAVVTGAAIPATGLEDI
jgi:NAD(P)-dependent dehydrogenase (short-subunit alcohol dehydrogenase family)